MMQKCFGQWLVDGEIREYSTELCAWTQDLTMLFDMD
jgi:hypothetical protein